MVSFIIIGEHHAHDCMVVGFTITYAVSVYLNLSCESESSPGEVYSLQHFAIKFVGDLRKVGDFLRVLWFTPQITLIATI